MRYLIFAALIASPASALDAFATRDGCLGDLQRALFSVDVGRNSVEVAERRLSEAPEAAAEHVEAALDAVRRRSQATIDYAEAVLLICQSYDQ